MGQPVTFSASDGFSLAGELFLPAGEPWAAVVIAAAMGVARRFYQPFAEHLATEGMAALLVDYRGMGGSRKGPLRSLDVHLHEWGELDLPAAVRVLEARFPTIPLLWVGHSVGGQLLGLYDGPPIRGALLVGSQSGHWRHWDGAKRLGMSAFWYVGVPLLTAAFSRLPMKLLGQGEDVPTGVAREWARWGRHRDYILSYAAPKGGLHFTRFSGALRSYSIADDTYAPRPAVEALFGGFTGTSSREVRAVSPADVGVLSIGHFGFFRPAFRDTLWKEAVDWLRSTV